MALGALVCLAWSGVHVLIATRAAREPAGEFACGLAALFALVYAGLGVALLAVMAR